MAPLHDDVLPYLKARMDDGSGPVLALSEYDSPVLEPYVGELLISYVVDKGSTLRLVTEGELRASGIAAAELHGAALTNLTRKIEAIGVRVAPARNYLAVLFDGNFEATLLLWNELWPHVHAQLGPELVAVAPARDILAVSTPAAVDALRAVVDRAWPTGDHRLTREVLTRTEGGWSIYAEAQASPPPPRSEVSAARTPSRERVGV